MSKAFEKFLEQSKKDGLTIYPGPLHNAAFVAWNAALEHAAKVCDRLISGDGICADDGVWIHDCAEAIRKEKTE